MSSATGDAQAAADESRRTDNTGSVRAHGVMGTVCAVEIIDRSGLTPHGESTVDPCMRIRL